MLDLICDALNGDSAALLVLGVITVGLLVVLSRIPVVVDNIFK